jgi:hypothetical protein
VLSGAGAESSLELSSAPGSPRSWSAPEIRAELLSRSNAIEVLADICAGKKLFCGPKGEAGKPAWRYPSIAHRMRALEIVLSKVVPDLKSSEVTGKDGVPLYPENKQVDTTALALAIYDWGREQSLRRAAQNDAPLPVIDAAQSLASPVAANAPVALESVPAAQREREYQVGETECFSNGASIQFVEISGSGQRKWEIRDSVGTLLGYRREHADAVALAQS